MRKLLPSVLVLALFLSGCGGGDSSNSDDFDREEEQLPEPDAVQGVYRTDLKPVNPRVNSDVEGQALLRLQGDNFEANVAARNVSSTFHRQVIHQLKNCPDNSADVNQDGLISAAEASAVTGEVFIPLDGDLDNNSEDAQSYPNGGFVLAYAYQKKASRSRLLQDLGPGVKFDLQDKVIMIYGVDNDETLPIACGELFQVTGFE